VVVISHGTGGAGEDLDWLACPLNAAGYLVASVDHHGNSYNDEYLVEGFTLAWERPKDISILARPRHQRV
jgi:predicted dienelactone hydrolase